MNRKALPALLLALLAAATTGRPLPAQEKEQEGGFTVEKFLAIPMTGRLALSPQGDRIAFYRVERDLEKDTYNRILFLARPEQKRVTRLTGKGHSDWNPFWSKDGSTLYFFSNRGGKTALYANRFDGTDPRRIVGPRKEGLGKPTFSPDGRRLAFLAPPAKAKGFGRDPEVRTTLEDRSRWPQLWIKEIDSGRERQLTDGSTHVYDFDWSPDATRLAFTADRRGSSAVTEDHYLAMIDLKGKVKVLADQAAQHSRPCFSPTGDRLAFLRDRRIERGYYVNVTDLFVMDLDTGKVLQLTADAPYDLGGGGWTRWHPDGESLWFLAARRAQRRLYRIPAVGGKARQVSKGKASVVTIDLDEKCTKAAFTMSDFAHPADLFTTSLKEWQPRRWTKVRDSVAAYGLTGPSTMIWSSPDGIEVEGFLFLPPAMPKGAKVPLVVEIHGGPAGCWYNMFSHRYLWHLFAARGWATFLPNIRGSISYGEEFLRGNLNDFGGNDFKDVVAGVETVLDLGSIDKEKLAISGYSYGGFMVNMAITKTDMFKAAVSIAGGFNFLSCFAQTNPVLPEVYYNPLGSPKNLVKAFGDSPVASIHRVETPLLLMHGKRDEAVHYMQSLEFYNMLKLLEKPAKLILYPGEGHGINRPSHMVHYMKAEIDWLTRHLEEKKKE